MGNRITKVIVKKGWKPPTPKRVEEPAPMVEVVTPRPKAKAPKPKQVEKQLTGIETGGFIEFFGEEAKAASSALGLCVTIQHRGTKFKKPMAGFPVNKREEYEAKLTTKGYRLVVEVPTGKDVRVADSQEPPYMAPAEVGKQFQALSDMLAEAAKPLPVKPVEAKPTSAKGTAPHVVVDALAGTGKTFTLVVGVARMYLPKVRLVKGLGFDPIPSPQQSAVWKALAQEKTTDITYIAFNRSIVDDFAIKWKWITEGLGQRGVRFVFSTINSMGFRVCCNAYGLDRDSVNNYKTRNLLEQHLDVNMRSFAKENPVFVQAVEEMVRLCKLTLTDPTEEALAEMAIQFDIELGRDREWVFATVPIILELARTETKEIDFADQVWLPVVNNLPLPSVGLLLLDEAQDTNRCSQELAIRIGERLVVCGDINQAIYGFAGADTESIPRLANSLGESTRGVQRLPLTETRRCGKAIVTEAAKLVPAFTAHESNPPGLLREIQARELQGQLVDGDMVLCRVNAPLIGLAFALLRSGRKAEIQGRSIGDGLKATIKRSLADTVGEFLKWLDDYHNTERNRLNERKNPPEQAIVALGDRVACLQTFCHGTKTLKEVEASIDAIFKDNTKGGILLSSGHRAKGLEAKRVFILEPELIPHPMAKSESAQAQELNLKYVMQTRAIEELITVYGDEKEA